MKDLSPARGVNFTCALEGTLAAQNFPVPAQKNSSSTKVKLSILCIKKLWFLLIFSCLALSASGALSQCPRPLPNKDYKYALE